ncbi:MAG: 50S ribosomal protein L24 [Candidatus Berkelbacteria bacterium]|nr:50S ribosomal protein L24 [Candidatus Berkelbacteria bacterium]
MEKIRKGDTVVVAKGRDRGKVGPVIKVIISSQKALVDGVNIYKKQIKPSKKYPQGGIIDMSQPIPVSNLRIICPNCKKMTKARFKNLGKEKRRVCINCKEILDVTNVNAK